MRDLLKPLAGYGAAELVAKAFLYAVSVLLARFLGAESYGVVALVLALIQLVSMIAGAGHPNASLKMYAEAESTEDREAILGSVLTLIVGAGAITLLALAGSRILFEDVFATITLSLAVPATIGGVFLAVLMVFQLHFRLGEEISAAVTLRVGSITLYTLLALGFAILAEWGAVGFAVGAAASYAIGAGAAVVYWYSTDRKLRYRRAWGGLALVGGAPYLVQAVLAWVNNFGNQFIVEEMLTARAVGLYAAAFSLAQLMLLPITALMQAWVPRFLAIRAELGDAVALSQHAAFGNFLVWVVANLALALSAIAPWLVPILVGSEYLPAVPLVILLSFGLLTSVYYHLCLPAIQIYGRGQMLLAASAIAGAVGVGANILAIDVIGVWGAGIGYICGLGTLAAVVTVIAVRNFGWQLDWIFTLPLQIGAGMAMVLIASLSSLLGRVGVVILVAAVSGGVMLWRFRRTGGGHPVIANREPVA